MEKIGERNGIPNNIRPKNLIKAIFGDDVDLPGDEELAMKGLLIDKYKKDGRSFFDEVKKWREVNPDKTYSDAIRALYELEE